MMAATKLNGLALMLGVLLWQASAAGAEMRPPAAKPKTAIIKTGIVQPRAKPAAGVESPTRLVRALQAALNRQGAGLKVDGNLGPKTVAAYKRFQTRNRVRKSPKGLAPRTAKRGT